MSSVRVQIRITCSHSLEDVFAVQLQASIMNKVSEYPSMPFMSCKSTAQAHCAGLRTRRAHNWLLGRKFRRKSPLRDLLLFPCITDTAYATLRSSRLSGRKFSIRAITLSESGAAPTSRKITVASRNLAFHWSHVCRVCVSSWKNGRFKALRASLGSGRSVVPLSRHSGRISTSKLVSIYYGIRLPKYR